MSDASSSRFHQASSLVHVAQRLVVPLRDWSMATEAAKERAARAAEAAELVAQEATDILTDARDVATRQIYPKACVFIAGAVLFAAWGGWYRSVSKVGDELLDKPDSAENSSPRVYWTYAAIVAVTVYSLHYLLIRRFQMKAKKAEAKQQAEEGDDEDFAVMFRAKSLENFLSVTGNLVASAISQAYIVSQDDQSVRSVSGLWGIAVGFVFLGAGFSYLLGEVGQRMTSGANRRTVDQMSKASNGSFAWGCAVMFNAAVQATIAKAAGDKEDEDPSNGAIAGAWIYFVSSIVVALVGFRFLHRRHDICARVMELGGSFPVPAALASFNDDIRQADVIKSLKDCVLPETTEYISYAEELLSKTLVWVGAQAMQFAIYITVLDTGDYETEGGKLLPLFLLALVQTAIGIGLAIALEYNLHAFQRRDKRPSPRLVSFFTDLVSIFTAGLQYVVGNAWGVYIFSVVGEDSLTDIIMATLVFTGIGVLMNFYVIEKLPDDQAKVISVSFRKAKAAQGKTNTSQANEEGGL